MPKKTTKLSNDTIKKVSSKKTSQDSKQSDLQTSAEVKKSQTQERRFLLLKITLLGINPPIWRQVVVPADLTLLDLHEILQMIMPWEGEHLYGFSVGHRPSSRKSSRSDYDYDGFDNADDEDAQYYDMSFLTKKGMKLIYTYDFGDSWEHEIVVENPDYKSSGEQLVCVLDGKRNAPPEDCGGFFGYNNIIENIANPGKNEVPERIDDYDPEDFSIDSCNAILARFFKNSKNTTKKKNKISADF
ncbi:MAG: plasmid pRiA4b ORF-3 family protein [Planctomycetaceae bacterium]|jgi:hypothetical protein|nr:plasmid pRiA4b ORF-3 family protein [Planctomycetaceae bacterium]